jgi:hypothetical protein
MAQPAAAPGLAVAGHAAGRTADDGALEAALGLGRTGEGGDAEGEDGCSQNRMLHRVSLSLKHRPEPTSRLDAIG